MRERRRTYFFDLVGSSFETRIEGMNGQQQYNFKQTTCINNEIVIMYSCNHVVNVFNVMCTLFENYSLTNVCFEPSNV